MGFTVTIEERFTQIQCWSCAIKYYVPFVFHGERRKDGGTFYCPNGHAAGYHETEADKLRQERDRLAQRIAEREDEIQRQSDLRQATERRLSAAHGSITKLKNRAKAGVCPCCSRHFENVERHMKSKHPTFDPKQVEEGVTIQ